MRKAISTGPEGYLAALATCYRAYKTEFALPAVVLPWEAKIELAAAA